MNTQGKLKLINEILENTDISIQDDYFEDIFKDENNVEIFRVMSSRLLSKYPERENDLLDEIIENLNKYLELTAKSVGKKYIAHNGWCFMRCGLLARMFERKRKFQPCKILPSVAFNPASYKARVSRCIFFLI